MKEWRQAYSYHEAGWVGFHVSWPRDLLAVMKGSEVRVQQVCQANQGYCVLSSFIYNPRCSLAGPKWSQHLKIWPPEAPVIFRSV